MTRLLLPTNDEAAQKLGFEDIRDFINSFGHWCYNRNFTYQSVPTTLQSMFRLMMKDREEK